MVLGLLLILFFFIWLFHFRKYSDYDPSEYDTETDRYPSKAYWEYIAKFDKLGFAVLSILSLLLGLALIYNSLANYYGWILLFDF